LRRYACSDDQGQLGQLFVPFVCTPTKFGGQRTWFRRPGCFAEFYTASTACVAASAADKYQSQYQAAAFRLLDRANKRWRTYRRLECLVLRLETAGWAVMSAHVNRDFIALLSALTEDERQRIVNRSSEEFLSLKKKTQRDYGRMLDIFAPIDHHPAGSVRRRQIRELSKTFAGRKRTEKLFGQVESVLFNFTVDIRRDQPRNAHELCWPAHIIEGMDGRGAPASKRATRHGMS
jgi:hypothetical protein